jgi:hypothetical protein
VTLRRAKASTDGVALTSCCVYGCSGLS